MSDLKQVLIDVSEYMRVRMDADHDGAGFVPNEEMRLYTAVEAELEAVIASQHGDAEDAARWRAVIGCARIRVLGSVGLHSEADMYGNPHGNYAHIGLELWTQHDAPSFPEAIADFTKFADKAIAAAPAPSAGRGESP